jgi:DNA-binding Lrp family transcriptional regulator
MADLTTPEGQSTETQRSHVHPDAPLDSLDVALLSLLREHPRVGVLELSRLASVARPTVQSRLQRMEAEGIITGYGPDVDLTAAGFPVHAFVWLEIAQGALEHVAKELSAIPGVIEAYATTGTSDVLCRVAATSHQDLQETLLALNRSATVVRSTSTIVLSVVVPPRVIPLLAAGRRRGSSRAPAYRQVGT